MRCLRRQPQTAIHRLRLGALRELGMGDWLPPKAGAAFPSSPPLPGNSGVRGAALPRAGSALPPRSPSRVPESPARPPPRSQRRPRCDARGGEAAARAFAWAEGKAASPVCFIFSWQLRTAQRSSAPPAGRAGRQAREDRAGRAGGRTGHRRSEVTAGEPQPGGLRSAPGSRPGGCEQGEAGKGTERQAAASGVPSLRLRFTPGWRLAAWLLPRRSRGAPGPCRWPVLGWSWERFSLLPSPPSLSWPSPRLRSGSR